MTKTALVTGAGSGIGRHSALALSKAGYAVSICGRREESLQATVAMAGSDGESITPIICDVAEPQGVAKMFTEIEGAHGRLDVLFNNAGANTPSTNFGDLTFEQWKHVIDVNLSGVFLCARHAFELMRRQDPQGGRIINNGSISAHVPRPDAAPYNATKAGVCGLTKSAAVEGRKYDIACGQIDIGNALTKQTYKVEEGMMQANGSMQPEPTIDPDDVADAVVYMASLPLSTNVLSLTVMATKMPYVGRG